MNTLGSSQPGFVKSCIYSANLFGRTSLSHVIAPGEVCRVCTVSTIVAAKLCKRFTNSASFLVGPFSHTAPDEVSRVGTI